MKKNHWIIIIVFFICHYSMAQTDSLDIFNFPFDSCLTRVDDNYTFNIVKYKDSLVQIEKIDSTKKWKLVGLTISSSTNNATEDYFPWTSKSNAFKAKITLPTINYNTLNAQFELNKADSLKVTDWTPFIYKNFLLIKKYNSLIGSRVHSWTIYEYYFEEIEETLANTVL